MGLQPMHVTVGDLHVGQVISVEGAGFGPALIQRISHPIGELRWLHLRDLESTELRDPNYVLNVHRRARVHQIPVAQHWYQNITGETVTVRLGRTTHVIAPGLSFAYAGVAQPSIFRQDRWSHAERPLMVDPTGTTLVDGPRPYTDQPSPVNNSSRG